MRYCPWVRRCRYNIPMLQVFLLLNSLPQDAPAFATQLQALHQSLRLNLTVINNGQPFGPKRMFHQLGLTCKLIEYPLRFHPAQLLAAQLEQPAFKQAGKIRQILWFEDTLVWHSAHLTDWLGELDNWTWIAPRLLPSQTLPQTRQIYQMQALAKPEGQARLQAMVPEVFPPGFCFAREAIPILKEWLRPEGQLPLLMMPACDMATPAWHPGPAAVENPAVLRIDEALDRWQTICAGGEPARQQVLLESLQRALPDSPAVYARLAPLLPADEAVELLEIALRRRLFYPELLALMVQALMACHQPELAGLYLRHLQQRFVAYAMPASPWPKRGGKSLRLHPEALPRPARLSIAVLRPEAVPQLTACLASLAALDAEVLVFDTTGAADLQAAVAAAGAQLYGVSAESADAELANLALEQASGDWLLMLGANEVLTPGSLPILRRLLADPPLGLPCFCLPVVLPEQGRQCQELRLLPRHPLLRFSGEPCVLGYEGPGEQLIGLLAGVSLERLVSPESPARLQRRIAQLEAAPPAASIQQNRARWRALAEAHTDAGAPAAALMAWQEALNLNTEPVALLGLLETLVSLARWQEGLLLARQHEKSCQHLPDYWYLRGLAARQLQAEDEALGAFERSLKTSVGLHVGWLMPARAGRLPLLALAQVYRARMHDPAHEPRQRQQAAQQLLATLQQLLQLEPLEQLLTEIPLLFVRLAQAALVASRMQRNGPEPGPSPLALYTDYLPAESARQLGADYAETALLYLDGPPESLMDRLPADYGFETVRELQRRPYTLLAFCRELWERSELDGPQLVMALLTLAAQAHQDLSLWLLLSHLLVQSGQAALAQEVLEDACMQLPGNPYLLCHLARLQLDAGDCDRAQHLIRQALSLRPDLEEALHLQQELLACRRRQSYAAFSRAQEASP